MAPGVTGVTSRFDTRVDLWHSTGQGWFSGVNAKTEACPALVAPDLEYKPKTKLGETKGFNNPYYKGNVQHGYCTLPREQYDKLKIPSKDLGEQAYVASGPLGSSLAPTELSEGRSQAESQESVKGGEPVELETPGLYGTDLLYKSDDDLESVRSLRTDFCTFNDNVPLRESYIAVDLVVRQEGAVGVFLSVGDKKASWFDANFNELIKLEEDREERAKKGKNQKPIKVLESMGSAEIGVGIYSDAIEADTSDGDSSFKSDSSDVGSGAYPPRILVHTGLQWGRTRIPGDVRQSISMTTLVGKKKEGRGSISLAASILPPAMSTRDSESTKKEFGFKFLGKEEFDSRQLPLFSNTNKCKQPAGAKEPKAKSFLEKICKVRSYLAQTSKSKLRSFVCCGGIALGA